MADALLNEEGWKALAGIRLKHLNKVNTENEKLRYALLQAKLQLEYLHDKFPKTGTSEMVLARINAALKE